MSKLFGTDGIRGTAGTDLTTELVAEVGRALVSACREGALGTPAAHPRIVVGRDTRVSGPDLEGAFVAGVCSAGGDALVGGVLPTAGVAYLTAELGSDAGVVVSASHNPPADNGIKFFGPGGWKLSPEAEAAIDAGVGSTSTSDRRGTAEALSGAATMYLDHLTGAGRADLTGLRVVIDCANGAASSFAPAAFERLGATVRALNAEGDGSRINEGCGALHPEVVAEAAERDGAIGLTLDGDADRALLADETGTVVDGDGIIATLAARMRSEGALPGNGVVVTVMSNQALRRWCAENGIVLVETPVGDRYVLGAMREHGYVLGGEQAGHVARLDQMTTGDGILIGLDVCGVVARNGGRLADIVPFRSMPQVLVNVPTARGNGVHDEEAVRAAIAEAERRLGSDGRVLVRPSGTEPLVRVMVEAPDRGLAGRLAEYVAEAVKRESR
ncbi:MAG: phosphoglucosamine mutase [Actinomycetota bacterium]